MTFKNDASKRGRPTNESQGLKSRDRTTITINPDRLERFRKRCVSLNTSVSHRVDELIEKDLQEEDASSLTFIDNKEGQIDAELTAARETVDRLINEKSQLSGLRRSALEQQNQKIEELKAIYQDLIEKHYYDSFMRNFRIKEILLNYIVMSKYRVKLKEKLRLYERIQILEAEIARSVYASEEYSKAFEEIKAETVDIVGDIDENKYLHKELINVRNGRHI